MTFNTTVIRDVASGEFNIHLAVHPFFCPDVIRRMVRPGHYGEAPGVEEMADSRKALADSLWEALPGLATLFFANGMITIQHAGVFSDKDIKKAANAILYPYLDQALQLLRIEAATAEGGRDAG